MKLRSALVYIGHTREGVVGQQLTDAQTKSKVILVLAQIQMGKASTRTGFLALVESFPLQTTTTSRKKILKVFQDQNSQTTNSNNVEFATYSIFTPFLCPLRAKVPIPTSELYTASGMSQANGSSQFHTVIPSLSRPIYSVYLLSQLEMPKLPRATHSLTLRKKRIQSGQPLNNGTSTAHLQRERIWLLPVSLKDLWLIIIQ